MARWLVSLRPMLARARSARAAPAGSSLALLMRLPVVSWSCSEVISAWRRERMSTPLSKALAVLMRMEVISLYLPICRSVSNTDCATCSSFAAAW